MTPTTIHHAGIGFAYLAFPYTGFLKALRIGGDRRPADDILQEAFNEVNRLTAILIEEDVPVFSPITHSHPPSKLMKEGNGTDPQLWLRQDFEFLPAASWFILSTWPGWDLSAGMAAEVGLWRELRRGSGRLSIVRESWCDTEVRAFAKKLRTDMKAAAIDRGRPKAEKKSTVIRYLNANDLNHHS